MTSFGEKLRELREARRMTLRALATAADLSAPFLSDVEHGRRVPSPEKIDVLARELGVASSVLHELDPRTRTRTTEERIALLESRVARLEGRWVPTGKAGG